MTTNWSRRTFLSVAVAGAAASVAEGVDAAAPARGSDWPLGVQLFSVDAELKRDLPGTLRQLARIGFREVELAGLHGHTPAAFAQAVRAAGLRAVGAHWSMADLIADPARYIAETRDTGAAWLVAASPRPDRPLAPKTDWLVAMHDAMTAEAWTRNADALNGLAEKAQAAGLSFAYHNHPIEFARYDGVRGIDALLARTDPAMVKWELDVAWAAAGGADPAALLRAHRDRIRLLHVKGLNARPPIGTYGTDFTTGIVGDHDTIDWRAVFAAARGSVRHAFVEQEPPFRVPVFAALARCRDALRRLA